MISKDTLKQLNKELLPGIIVYVSFVSFIFIYLLKVVQPELLYYKLQPFFTADGAYIEFHKNFRLGFVSIIAQFLLQFLHYPVVGTIILTFVFSIIAFLFRISVIKTISSKLNGIEFIPIVILLLSLKNYSEATNTAVIFGISSVFLIFNHLLCNQKVYFKIPYHILAIIVSYLIFGFITAFMVCICLLSYELITKTTYKVKLILIFIDILVIAYLFWIAEGVELAKISFKEASAENKFAQLPVFWNLIYFYIVIVFLSLILNLKFIDQGLNYASRIFPKQWYFIFIFIVVTGILFKKRFINENKYIVLINYYADEKKWDKVLKMKSHIVLNDRIPRFQMNRALYHSGKMAENMFSLPQEWSENALLLTNDATRECTFHSSDLFFDMGFIQGARYWAYEAQTYNPYSPNILKRLAITNMILKEDSYAKKYLSILNNSFIHKKWAQEYLELYNQGDTSGLNKKISVFPNTSADSMTYTNNSNPNYMLIKLLKSNPTNKMVFEYLMAYYLLKNEIGKMIFYFKFIDNLDYKEIPRTYQEALLLFYMNNEMDPRNQKYPVSKNCMVDFNNFNNILKEYNYNKKFAQKDIKKYFGDNYWYYVMFESPFVTNRKIKKRQV